MIVSARLSSDPLCQVRHTYGYENQTAIPPPLPALLYALKHCWTSPFPWQQADGCSLLPLSMFRLHLGWLFAFVVLTSVERCRPHCKVWAWCLKYEIWHFLTLISNNKTNIFLNLKTINITGTSGQTCCIWKATNFRLLFHYSE